MSESPASSPVGPRVRRAWRLWRLNQRLRKAIGSNEVTLCGVRRHAFAFGVGPGLTGFPTHAPGYSTPEWSTNTRFAGASRTDLHCEQVRGQQTSESRATVRALGRQRNYWIYRRFERRER